MVLQKVHLPLCVVIAALQFARLTDEALYRAILLLTLLRDCLNGYPGEKPEDGKWVTPGLEVSYIWFDFYASRRNSAFRTMN